VRVTSEALFGNRRLDLHPRRAGLSVTGATLEVTLLTAQLEPGVHLVIELDDR
jgi:hypothetical protein